MMIFAGLTFAAMNVGVKLLPGIPVAEIVFFRALVSLIISYLILVRKGIPILGNNRKILIMRGLFGTSALLLFFYTIHVLPLASAMVIHYLSPIFTAIIAHLVLGERMAVRQIFYFSISFIGILVMKGFDARLTWLDLFAGVAAAFLSGAAYNSIRRLKFSEDSHVIILYFPLIALPVTAVYMFFFAGWVTPNMQQLGLLIMVGILTQIAQYFLTKAYQSELANKVAAISNIGIIYALGIGLWIFDEVFNPWSVVGMVLVVLGVVLNVVKWDAIKARLNF
jgi:drug/metabolite transporter (DMT)-like permease